MEIYRASESNQTSDQAIHQPPASDRLRTAGEDRRIMKTRWLACFPVLGTSIAWSQQVPHFEVQTTELIVDGWTGFTDLQFLINLLLTLTLAAVLGAIIAYHPRYVRSADTLQELEAPKVYILYAVIGSLIGILVVKYGLVIGFVLFGIGGLIRFRTVLRSAHLTGHVIFVTLIGLATGLALPHVAVVATAFGFLLIYVLHARITYRIDVRGLSSPVVGDAAAAYRRVLEQQGCRILSEKKNPAKERVSLIFRASPGITRRQLEEIFDSRFDELLKGSLDWEID